MMDLVLNDMHKRPSESEDRMLAIRSRRSPLPEISSKNLLAAGFKAAALESFFSQPYWTRAWVSASLGRLSPTNTADYSLDRLFKKWLWPRMFSFSMDEEKFRGPKLVALLLG